MATTSVLNHQLLSRTSPNSKMAAKMIVVVLLAALCAVAYGGQYGNPYNYGRPTTTYYYNAVADVDVRQTPYNYQYRVNEYGPYHSKYIHQSAELPYGYSSYGYPHY